MLQYTSEHNLKNILWLPFYLFRIKPSDIIFSYHKLSIHSCITVIFFPNQFLIWFQHLLHVLGTVSNNKTVYTADSDMEEKNSYIGCRKTIKRPDINELSVISNMWPTTRWLVSRLPLKISTSRHKKNTDAEQRMLPLEKATLVFSERNRSGKIHHLTYHPEGTTLCNSLSLMWKLK